MNLSNKPCYPAPYQAYENHKDGGWYIECADGLTFRERLIVALASNPAMTEFIALKDTPKDIEPIYGKNAKWIINQADAIIAEMEK